MADSIHNGHRERMRKKFLKFGFDVFEEHEILELLLFYSIPRTDTNKTAHRLLDKYKTISAVFDADLEDLKEVEGISESSAILLKMIPCLSKAYTISLGARTSFLNKTNIVLDYFKNQFLNDKTEKIRIVCLDSKLKLIAEKVIAEGSPGQVSVTIRSIAEFTYQNKCDNVIMAHNHPNGDTTPSDEDIRSTAKIYKALKDVGINLLDHIIVAGNDAISLRESGAFSLLK